MRDENRRRLDEYWVAFFGIDPGELSPSALSVREHPPAFRGYEGAYLLRRAGGSIMFVPPRWLERVRAATRGMEPASLFDPGNLTAIFGEAVDTVIGRATVAYADDTDFTPVEHAHARLLTQDDAPALERLRDACPPLDWGHAGDMHIVQHPTFAVFDGDDIVAAASCDFQGDFIRHVGIITHPQHRGRGHASAAASALTAHGLDEGDVMQWQTLEENVPSSRIGARLGYRTLYETISVRLRG